MTNEDFLASHQSLQPLLLPLHERNKAFPLCGALQVNLPLTSPSPQVDYQREFLRIKEAIRSASSGHLNSIITKCSNRNQSSREQFSPVRSTCLQNTPNTAAMCTSPGAWPQQEQAMAD